jgi:DNA polymerase I-like protein with 3'-5' exonuclease and polymerase domains
MLVGRSIKVGEYKTTKAGKYVKGDPKYAMKRIPQQPTLPSGCEWVVPVLHPAGIMRMQFKTLPALKADLMRVGKLLRGEANVISTKDISWLEEDSELPKSNVWAIDIETPMPPNDWVVERIGLGCGSGVLSTTDVSHASRLVEGILGDSTCTAVLHNSSFDLPRLGGVDSKAKLFDTMAAAQLLNPDLPKGLERAATIHLDVRPWKHLFLEDPSVYNAMDVRVTLALAQKQAVILDATGQRPVFETMMRAMPTLMRLTERGIRVDEGRLKAWRESLEKNLAEAHARWARPDISPTSYPKLVKYLYEDLALPKQYSKDGGLTTDDAAIFHLLGLSPPAPARRALESLRDIRASGRNLGTYAAVEASPDGRVHPRYVTADKDESGATFSQKGHGAGTGRIQARDPNIMNQPVEARRLYVPTSPGWAFAYVDWASAEARVEAALSEDDKLMEALGDDLHEVIRASLNIDRTRAKNIFYGCVPMDTEALTRGGWRRYEDLEVGQDIMVYDPKSDTMKWGPMEYKVHYRSAPLMKLENQYFKAVTTPNHRWYGDRRITSKNWRRYTPLGDVTSEAFTYEHRIRLAAPFEGGLGVPTDCLHKWNTDWISYVLGATPSQRAAFLNGVIISDGHMMGANDGYFGISQKPGELCEAMRLAAVLHGFRVNSSVEGINPTERMRLGTRRHITGDISKSNAGTGDVWCPKVATSYWLMKQGHRISITGNTGRGAGPRTLSRSMADAGFPTSIAECEEMQNRLFRLFPKWAVWRNSVVDEGRSQGWVSNPFGRRRYFYTRNVGGQMIGFTPQSTVADMLWTIIPEVPGLVTMIHDAVLVEAPLDKIQATVAQTKEIMEREWPMIASGFKVPTDVKVGMPGESWGDMELRLASH